MKAGRFQSLCAKALIAGLVLAALGGWGTWYFGSKLAQEKERQWALKEQKLNDEISSLKLAGHWNDKQAVVDSLESGTMTRSGHANSSPSPATPAVHAPARTPAPALITSESGRPSAAPSQPGAAGWKLSDAQRQKIADALRKHAGKNITICSAQSDAEGSAFAAILKRLFEDAGWSVDGVKQVPYAKPPAGLNLAAGSFPLPENLIAIDQAFASAGFHVSQQLDAKLTGAQVELIVGATQ